MEKCRRKNKSKKKVRKENFESKKPFVKWVKFALFHQNSNLTLNEQQNKTK